MDFLIPFFESQETKLLMLLCIVTLVLIILLFITMMNVSAMKGRYKRMNKGKNILSFEEHIIKNGKDIERLKQYQTDVHHKIEKIDEKLIKDYSKVVLRRYNAFAGQGGEMSFVLVLLNDERNGVIIQNIYNNNSSFIYAKRVERGSTKEALSEEEKETLLKAIKEE